MAPLTVQAIDRFIGSGNPLAQAGGAQTLLRATGGNLAGAAFLAALARKESSFGATAGKFRNNFWGWGVHLGPNVHTSPTVEEGARKVWTGLQSGLYKGAGLTTPSAIIQKYAPPSENNTGLYQSQVNQWFTQLGLSPQTNIFSGATVPVQPGQAAPRSSASSGAAPGFTAQGNVSLTPRTQKQIRNYIVTSQRDVQQGRTPRDVLPIVQRLAADPSPGAGAAIDGLDVVGQSAQPSRNQFRNAANEVLGIDYSWGGGSDSGPTKGFGRGANTTGFDCSSLVKYLWAKRGVALPRTTYDQINVGTPVANIAQARPGDLVFPHKGHVQMYLGNGQVVEAPRTGGKVQIVPARSRYLAIRRPA